MADHGQIIAEAIVDYVQGLPATTYSRVFTITAPEDPALTVDFAGEERHEGIKVFVVPVSKTIEKIDRGNACMVEPTINLFMSRFLDEATATRKNMNALLDEIEQSLRVDQAPYCWQGTEVITLYDPQRLRVQRRFFAVLGLTYLGIEE